MNLEEGWVFHHKKMKEELRQEFLNLDFDVADESTANSYRGELEVPRHTFELYKRPDLVQEIKEYLCELDIPEEDKAKILTKDKECFCHYFEYDEEFYSHLDEPPGFEFYAIIYVTETDNYHGRELLYRNGPGGELKVHKPKDGDVCFFDGSVDRELWHAVFRMLSKDIKVVSIIFGVSE